MSRKDRIILTSTTTAKSAEVERAKLNQRRSRSERQALDKLDAKRELKRAKVNAAVAPHARS